ncbi:hypothetical protein B296_00036699 [Ensete ventricosum]|uniref:Uncharacterized protein n=1 Tax=Ensete ventricosum TaxID=4639 RepID=A0A426Y715_ENSVE|nr:hypothetical protein B296_00036699 [Ensete ventricosum]
MCRSHETVQIRYVNDGRNIENTCRLVPRTRLSYLLRIEEHLEAKMGPNELLPLLVGFSYWRRLGAITSTVERIRQRTLDMPRIPKLGSVFEDRTEANLIHRVAVPVADIAMSHREHENYVRLDFNQIRSIRLEHYAHKMGCLLNAPHTGPSPAFDSSVVLSTLA